MILALHAAGPTTHIWLYPAGATPSTKPAAELTWDSGRKLADELPGRLAEFVATHAGGWPGLTGVVVFSGPGSFTSLRIGHTVANAAAVSLNIPIAGGTGDNWAAEAIGRLAQASPGQPVLPDYGSEPNITAPNSAKP